MPRPHNWVSLFAFLVAAIVGSNLSAAAQERARIAVERAQFLEEREAAEIAAAARRAGVDAAGVAQPRSQDAVDRDPRSPSKTCATTCPVEARRAQADAAAAELIRLTRLFEDILDMARIDAAAVPVQREWVTPADVVDAAMAHVRHAIDGHALRVDADDEHAVNIDARLASVALSHLLENAARYSPADRDDRRRRADRVRTASSARSPITVRASIRASSITCSSAFIAAAAPSRRRRAPAWGWRSRADC